MKTKKVGPALFDNTTYEILHQTLSYFSIKLHNKQFTLLLLYGFEIVFRLKT